MTRRKPRRAPIVVEDCSRSPLERLSYAMGVLARLDAQDDLDKLAWAAESIVACYERPDEPAHEFRARLARVNTDPEMN